MQEDLTETGIHVYSANVFKPMGLIDEKLLTDFDNEYIVWGIDGAGWLIFFLKVTNFIRPTIAA